MYENNVYKTDILVVAGDILEIKVTSGVARYYKNGALQYTSSKAPVYPLRVITSMIDSSSSIAQAMVNGTAPPPPSTGDVTWVNQVNTSVTGTTIRKTGGQPFMEDAGAASQQSVPSGNATFQYTVDAQ